MYYIAARISNQTIIEQGSNNRADAPGFLVSIAANAGILLADVTIYFPDQSETSRLLNGDEFDLVWTGSVITSLDFSTEDGKHWIRITTNKNRILGNNTDTAIITIEILQAGNKSQRINHNDTEFLPVQDPFRREIEFPLQFSAGVATINFATNRAYAGLWHFPHESVGLRFGNLRFDSKAKISVLYV